MEKKGNILTENFIFIILNLTFLAIMIIFIFLRMNSDAASEEMWAKQIALNIDAAKPGMVIELDMKKEIEVAEKKGLTPRDAVRISGNEVVVALSHDGGYSYSFFNDVKVSVDVFPTDSNKPGVVKLMVEDG